jgi:hypothetical protein
MEKKIKTEKKGLTSVKIEQERLTLIERFFIAINAKEYCQLKLEVLERELSREELKRS